jgi:hypothetical protein
MPDFSSVNDTAETISAVSLTLYKYLKQKKVGGCLDLIFGFSGGNDTAEPDFGDFRSYYPGEYDTIYKTVLAC